MVRPELIYLVPTFLLGVGAGTFISHFITFKTLKDKLKSIEAELETIEQTEERRVIVPIMRVTARIKALL